jgi:hypothetical protein
VTKSEILAEIVRSAQQNGGTVLGVDRFLTETGIKESDWQGKYWARWSDAVKEAGLQRNAFQEAYDEEFLLAKLASLARELGRYPTRPEIRLKARNEKGFPNDKTFSRLGSKRELATKLAKFCQGRKGYEGIEELCVPLMGMAGVGVAQDTGTVQEIFGYVYLAKSGRNYKIGRSKAVGRREYELAIQMPDKLTIVHQIKTDDPVGIEAYWHRRFGEHRKNGEWFELNAEHVSAFKRRKFM